MIVYVSIGNSDDKLTQKQWSSFHRQVDLVIHQRSGVIHGHWLSESSSLWQNACWCFEATGDYEILQDDLRALAQAFSQDSIAWAEVRETKFLGPDNG